MNKEEFVQLYEKYLTGNALPEEIQMLEQHHDEEMLMPDDLWNVDPAEKKRLYKLLKAKLKQSISDQYVSNVNPKYLWLKIAASILLISFLGALLWPKGQPLPAKEIKTAKAISKKILPGGNKAYLTTANGSVISLDDVENGQLSVETGIAVNKVKDGVLKYDGTAVPSENSNDFNTVTTPRGGQYQVVLADGTKVWLNSASSLKYPVAFSGEERHVELLGEAYFEVAKNKSKPFKVSVDGLSVQVLGTHFNIMAYNDEKAIKTTLLEGSVKLVAGAQQAMLKPGQQGTLNALHSQFLVEQVDPEDVVAWKNGYFAFNNEDIQTIMKRISRWYDVDVVFSEQLKRRNFGGTVSRFNEVTQVLKSLQLTGSVHFKIEGRRITVMP